MRRKSERNKAKASPEKKVEKPTRKSTRRRAGRKSPSTSPEPEAPSQKTESVEQVENKVEKEATALESKLQSSEPQVEQAEETNKEKVSPKAKDEEEKKEEDEDDAGSVWKVSRADASPGEIQKLKLCRQRNASEASSDSRRKDSNDKWQESGEGVAGEVDSAEEQLVSCRRMPSGEEPNDPSSSSCPGQESNQEEVSDSKDLLPETTSANLLSDDKPNIDRQGDACQADDKRVSEPKATSDGPPSPPRPASSNGQLENKDSTSQQQESAPKPIPQQDEDCRKEGGAENDEEKPTSTSTEDEDDKKFARSRRRRRSSSESNENREKDKINPKTPSRANRRKHRNKYGGDSSNSDSADSDDESRNVQLKIQQQTLLLDDKKEEDASEDKDNEPCEQDNARSNVESEENERNDRKALESASGKAQEEAPTTAQSAQKPAKVNLKRSFSARISVEKNEFKKEDVSGNANESASQNKENHAEVDSESRFVPKKRRWGKALSTDTPPAVSISTDSLKALVPGAKPLPINELRLSKDDDEERESHRSQEKRHDSSDSAGEGRVDEQKNGAVKKDGKMDNHIAARRKISIVKETPHMKSPSPPSSQPTNILLIKNLVRPFTLNQIKELLSRTGSIVENGFWMDRIKSKCFVEYSNEDQAFETRQALHGISWPLSNPKKLQVEYATKEEMEQARESSNEQIISKKAETVASNAMTDSWQQDWSQERSNSTKVTVVREWDLGKEDGQALLKDKEKKEHEKKRRQRSRSPGLEVHLPAPARKFKKKEDEPPPAKLLDDLFRKTKATPCIYWLPLTNEQIVVKEEMRRQHMAEHARRMEEMRRAERNRDGRRRRSPRK